ncbi:CAP domain-containing protein [Schleiferilactobacillus shenzhenensis]|uniref:SCP domain-containing protein n=1 Tax=Schleiferilactobacillus shenzhenensis LY-73 TaxID=1231336 RepID=U4TKC2_9LACO|nr:CAP domain-containing protein [Schleiferilactobacillus shenzhenensis]ERL65301.1 hypothetical protein L248_2700 [Schleiferilactobacillus shenzhenensis LY-73]
MMKQIQKHPKITATFTVVGAISALAGGGNVWVTPPFAAQPVVAATVKQYTPNAANVNRLILTEINRLRAQNHLSALRLNNTITTGWSNSIVAKNARLPELQHDPNQPAALNRMGFLLTGENLAATPLDVTIIEGGRHKPAVTNDVDLALETVAQYYDDYGVPDYGHRKNLLNPYFTDVGIAFALAKQADGTYMAYNALDFGGNVSQSRYNTAAAYFNYSQQNGLSSRYPSVYQPSSPSTLAAAAIKTSTPKRIATVHYRGGVGLFTGYGPTARFTRRMLPNGSRWLVDRVAKDNVGRTWYEVGRNQWIDAKYVTSNF